MLSPCHFVSCFRTMKKMYASAMMITISTTGSINIIMNGFMIMARTIESNANNMSRLRDFMEL